MTEPDNTTFPIYPVDLVLGHLDKVRRLPDATFYKERYSARCPAHEDRHPSLIVNVRTDDSVGLDCKAGCDWLDVVSALGLIGSQLYPDPRTGYVRQHTHGPRVTFARSDSLEGEAEDYAARMWERAEGAGWRRKMDAAADRLEGMFSLRRRYGHKF